jgi:two-component system phosphate regulon sensor histidine kinase PhoR
MRTHIFAKLLVAAAAVILVATVTLDTAVTHFWEASLRNQIRLSLTEKTQMLAHEVRDVSRPELQREVKEAANLANARATVITAEGKVLADSEANPPEMENHATRPEFIAALHGQIGSNARRSHTLGIEFLYVAAPVQGGAVRLAYPLVEIQDAVWRVRKTILGASALALMTAILLAIVVSTLIARRLRRIMQFAEATASGDLSIRISDNSYDEIGQVAAALDKTARRLEVMFRELETSRNQFETLLNSIQDPVLAVSHDRKVLWRNRAFQALIPSLRIRDSLIETVRAPEVSGALEESLSSLEIRTIRAVNLLQGRIFQCTVAPMPGGAVLVFHDVSDIERLEKTRRDFIANVSHELRTPLTSITGYTETLLESSVAGEASTREFLEVIRRNAFRMTRLTEDLLKLARVESGEWKLDILDVTADALLSEAYAALHNVAEQHGKQLIIESSSKARVLADKEAIQQVFANLIENACKYAPAGTQIAIGVNEQREKLEFFIRDSGPGIAAEHHARLFERFYRVDRARSREAGGTGLGLAIVKHIILNHGGSVRVESELGHGSTFLFTLPYAAVAGTHEDAALARHS